MRSLRAHGRVRKSLQVQSHVRKSLRAQAPVRKSQRIRNQGSTSRYFERDGELVHVKAPYGKQSSYAITTRDGMHLYNDSCVDNVDDDGDDDDEDTDDSDNDCVYKKGCDKDWVPKSQRENQIDSSKGVCNVDLATSISSCHAYRDTILTPDIGRFSYFPSDKDDGQEAIHAYNYVGNDVSSSRNAYNAGPPNTVTYVRRTRKSLQSIHKRFAIQRRRSCRTLSCVGSKVSHLPSWIKRKHRALSRKKDKWAIAIEPENSSWNAHAYSKSFETVKGSKLAKSSTVSQACEGSQSPSTTLLPPQPTSPVFLTTALEGLPQELAESEPIESSHELPTNNTERFSPQQMEKLGVEKKKSKGPEGLTQKLKRKKHRPKVLRDIFDKAKRMPKSRKKQLAEQGKDGVVKDKKKKLFRKPRAKKEQGSRESETKIKKGCGLKQETMSVVNNDIILADNNLSTISSCRSGQGISIIPFQANDLIGLPVQSKGEITLHNLTAKEVFYAQGLLMPSFYTREEFFKDLIMSTYLAEGQLRLSPELTNDMQGYTMALQCRQQQQSAPYIYANNCPLSLAFRNDSSSVFSLVHPKPEDSTKLLLTQEPNNKLELVAYDQRREIITSKSTRFLSKIRAKVQLDIENERIWPLLAFGGIPKEFEDVHYWEREKALMERQVDQFICTMKSVQGDRHFSPWKGSILDSLVGAFLTQNVSDHLSSSAFMSIASRFPFKQGNDSGRTDTNGSPRADTTCASEVSRNPRGALSETQEENGEHSDIQRDSDFDIQRNSDLPNQEGMPLTCRMPVRCMKIFNYSTSLRAVKKFLRNITTSHTEGIEVRTSVAWFKSLVKEDALKDEIHLNRASTSFKNLGEASALKDVNYSNWASTPFIVLNEEDSASKDKIHLNRASTSSRSLNEEDTVLKDEIHLNPLFPSLMGENLSAKKQHNIRIPGLGDYKISSTVQCGMQQKQGFAPCLLEAKSPSEQSEISVPRLDLQVTETVSQTMQTGMQHSEITSPCSAQEHNPIQLGNSSIPGVTDSTRVSMHPEFSMEDVNSTIHSTYDSSYHESRIDKLDDGGVNCKGEDTLCSTTRSEVSCNYESLSTSSTTRELLAGNDLSNALQKVRTPMKENYFAKQFTPEKSPEKRTEVYNNHAVCRSLFKDAILEKMHWKATTSLDCTNKQLMLSTFDTNLHADVHPYVVQNSMEVPCKSDAGHSAAIPSVSKIVGNKRRYSLSGIERAHMEENQYGRKKNHTQDWEALRKLILQSCSSCENTSQENSKEDAYQDSVDWDAVRCASVEELAATIKERGMHHVLSGRIKAFLKTLHEEQGSLDLEWLRKVSPENAKAYLMAIRGLGLKSVECIRLLALHHSAFPVDVNVGRICVRLGWVPIEPLPEQLQLHLLELYPVQETIQKYLWPRLCTLDQKKLYELHYQLITFGKVFCTKSKPNCNACPMRTQCKHFASAYASAKLLLTGSNVKPLKRLGASTQVPVLISSSVRTEEAVVKDVSDSDKATCFPLISEVDCGPTDCYSTFDHHYFIEEPASPETTHESDIGDIEDFPCIYGSVNDFTEDLLKDFSETPPKFVNDTFKEDREKCNLQSCLGDKSSCHHNTDEQLNSKEALSKTLSESCFGYQSDNPSDKKVLACESEVCQDTFVVSEAETNAIISLSEGAYIPAPKLKNVDRLRTIHYVYELPDNHPLLEQAEVREKDDPSFYLLAIWSPGEAPNSLQGVDEADMCKSSVANQNEIVSGTLLIPCRTAMRGKFPLNGTYFQVNEVFADHASSLRPLQVPRSHIWNLQRRFVYFGTSVSNIFRGLTSDEITCCFLRGHVCVRGFDREKRAPRPLVCRLHFPISKQLKRQKEHDQEALST